MSGPRHIVIGAGIVGVMTAAALARRGLAVTVLDRLPGPAGMCSRANAGIIALGHAAAWAGPDALPVLGRALLGRAPGIRVTRLADPALVPWGLAFLRNCTPARHAANSARLARLCAVSRAALPEIAQALGLETMLRFEGGLYLHRDAAALAAAGDHGMTRVDRDWLAAHEPALAAPAMGFAGGFLSPADGAGDCHAFACAAARALAGRHGAEFRHGVEVQGLERAGGRITGVRLADEVIAADQVILATGIDTARLTRPLGIAPLIYPVKGYSGTWTLREGASLPARPFIDETQFVAVASYGGRLRVTTIAEFAGRDRSLRPERIDVLRDYVATRFADATEPGSAEFWAGLRPSTPCGAPYLGRVRAFGNLWINAGHGQLGWTASAGCGALLAQAIAGEPRPVRDTSAPARWLDGL